MEQLNRWWIAVAVIGTVASAAVVSLFWVIVTRPVAVAELLAHLGN